MELPTVKVVVSEETVEVPEAILVLSSPVFRAMLGSGMQEASERVIKLPGKSREEFEAFVKFLDPRTLATAKVHCGNVDYLLEWGNEYDVPHVRLLCEQHLLTQPANVSRMLQANRCQLQQQRKRCIEEVGQNFEDQDMDEIVKEEPSLLSELLPEMKKGKLQKVEEVLKQRNEVWKLVHRLQGIANRMQVILPKTEVTVNLAPRKETKLAANEWAKKEIEKVISELK